LISYNVVRILLAGFCLLLLPPILFHYSYSLQAELVFLPKFRNLHSQELENPGYFGVSGGINHYVEVAGVGCCIGVWTIPSSSSKVECEALFCNSDPVVLYLHGQTANRGSEHRTQLYKRLQLLGLNVVSFDYRGFADSLSEGMITVESVVKDTETVMAWLKKEVSSSTSVMVWGHSLGSAVASHFMATTPAPVCALVLESAFNNLSDQIYLHSFASPWRLLLPRPLFSWLFTPLPELNFVTDQHLPHLSVPILLLHAQHDPVVSVELARRLFQSTIKLGRTTNIEFVELLNEEYGHSEMYKSSELPRVINRLRRHCDNS